MTERCKKCCFYGSSTDTCDHLIITGERRGCPPGALCTRFKKGTYVRQRRELAMTPRQVMRCRRMKELYDQGLNDHQIADLVGSHHQTVGIWRRKNNLPANARFGGDRKI